ncbi:MAG: glutamine amidotransferase, partial [Oricola sp.]
MPDHKTLAILLIEGFADWEYPLLAASARQWFGIDVRFLTPGASAVTSIAGLRFADGAAIESAAPGTLAALAVIGSDTWTGEAAPD